MIKSLAVVTILASLLNTISHAATISPLAARGYAALPAPQRVTLGELDLPFGPDWEVKLGPGVRPTDVAVESLKEELATRHRVVLKGGAAKEKVVRLSIGKDAVVVNSGIQERDVIADEAYRIDLSPREIRLTANAPPGLFYAVETLIQLLRRRNGSLWFPEGQIVDWPDLPLRFIYWDDAHHLERLSELKRVVRQAAFFKINGFVIKLEGHFQYKSAPALVEPFALSPSELQVLTDYGLRYHVQVIPYLDAPAHIAFILKHPEYFTLRAFPESNYEFCTTNPDSYKLLFGMYQDLLDANKGVKYFYLSTDEAYYVGLAKNAQCDEVTEAKNQGGVARLLAAFTTRAADYLHERGRTVLFWGEFPLKPDDVRFLPPHLINGEVPEPQFNRAFQERGIRQMIFTSTQGVEMLFPTYFLLPDSRRLHAAHDVIDRVPSQFAKISFDPARKQGNVVGEINCGWADSGLHSETFWLGYATSAAAGWHAGVPDPREAMSMFYLLFYGRGAGDMNRIYQLLSLQTQFWEDSWEVAKSESRKPIFGWSYGIFNPPVPSEDPTLLLPALPVMGSGEYGPDWREANSRRLELTQEFLAENDALLGMLHESLQRVEFNRYNIVVLISIAQLCRHNLEMIEGIGAMAESLKQAQVQSTDKPQEALASLDRALDAAIDIRRDRNEVLRDATDTWYKSWQPRVAEANGRRLVHELDDVKDHLPDRTIDMSYLVYRELILPFGEWTTKIWKLRNEYATAQGLPVRQEVFTWADITRPTENTEVK